MSVYRTVYVILSVSKCRSLNDLWSVSGEKCNTSAARAGHDQFERQVSVLVAGQVEPGPAGERQAAADGHPAAELVTPARGVRLGRDGIRQPGAPAAPSVPPPPPTTPTTPPSVPAAAAAPPTPHVPAIEPAVPTVPATHRRRRRLHASAVVVAASAAPTAAAPAAAVLPQAVGSQHGGRGRADGRFGRRRVRAVRQGAPDTRARVAQRKRPRSCHGV